jgi:hypothetical protein
VVLPAQARERAETAALLPAGWRAARAGPSRGYPFAESLATASIRDRTWSFS